LIVYTLRIVVVDQGGSALCCVSPARFAGSSFTYAKRTATLIRLRNWVACLRKKRR